MAYITFVVLSALQKLKIRLRAIKDARVNHMAVEDLKVAMIGPRPTPFLPTEDERHRRLQHRRTDIPKAEDLVADRQQKEEAHKKNSNPFLMWCTVALLYVIEFLSAGDVLRRAGLDGAAVVGSASLLTTGMFITANKCARQKPGTAAFYAWHAIFLGIGLFIAAIRFYTLVAREDASLGESVSLEGIMLAITIIPAFFAETCIRRAIAGQETGRDLALTKRQLKNEQKAIQAAHTDVESINEQVVKHDHVAGLIQSEYRRHWEYERKRLTGSEPPTINTHDDDPDNDDPNDAA
jgi:hypothetical protein